jgi:hypothetical protein
VSTGNYYDGMLGKISAAGVQYELMGGLNFIGVTITRDVVNNRLNVTFVGEQGPAGEQGPPGEDGVMNAPDDPGDDGRIPVADSGDLSYSANLRYGGGVLSVTGTVLGQLDGVGTDAGPSLRAVNGTAATLLNSVQRSPSLEFAGAAWDADDLVSREAVAYMQLVPVAGTTVAWSLVVWGNEAADERWLTISQSGLDIRNGGQLRARDNADSAWVNLVLLGSDDVVYYGHGGNAMSHTAANELAFFGGVPVAKPTGVAVSAAAIHAALVSLGLIEA